MEQTKVKLHILYVLVAVIVTCETRFRHLGQTYNAGHYDDRPTASNSQREKAYNERYPKNLQFNGAPLTGEYLPGRHTNQLPVYKGQLVSNRGRQAETNSYPSNQVPPGRLIGTYPPGFTQTVNNDGRSVLYDKSLFVSPGMGYANPTKLPEKVRIDPRYPLYDVSQVVHPYDDQNVHKRSPFHNKFKSPTSGQTNMNIHPAPYGGTSAWSERRHEVNKEESLAYDGYLGVRSFRDNKLHERGDLTVQDNFALYDSISNGDPTDYLAVKKRIMADYNFV